MANPFTPSSIGAAYDLNPPSDDGANTPDNEIAWNKHIDKIGDPLVAFNESTDANVNTAFTNIIGGGDTIFKAIDYEVQNADQGSAVIGTVAGITFTTPDAGIVDEPFYFVVLNTSSDTIFLDGNGAQTINGSALPISIGSGEGTLVWTDGNNWFVLSENLVLLIGAGVVSTAVNRTFIPADRGKLITLDAPDKTLTLDNISQFSDNFVTNISNNSTGEGTLAIVAPATLNGRSGPIRVLPGNGGQIWKDGSNWFSPGLAMERILGRGELSGLNTSNSTGDTNHDILFAEGQARDSTDLKNLILDTALTKRIDDDWAPGNNVGGLADNLSLLPNKWYHMHLVDTDAGGFDVGFDTSLFASNLVNSTPGIATRFRRIGAVLTNSSSNIYAYIQIADEFIWARMQEHEAFNQSISTTAIIKTAHVPLGLKIKTRLTTVTTSANGSTDVIVISDPDTPDDTADRTFPGFNSSAGRSDIDPVMNNPTVFTNTLSQLRYRANRSIPLDAAVVGYTDTRGRFD